MKYIWTKGKYYSQLGVYGGRVHLGKPLDVNNESVKSGVIWEMQPFSWAEETPILIRKYFDFIRFFKTDVFGNSGIKNLIRL